MTRSFAICSCPECSQIASIIWTMATGIQNACGLAMNSDKSSTWYCCMTVSRRMRNRNGWQWMKLSTIKRECLSLSPDAKSSCSRPDGGGCGICWGLSQLLFYRPPTFTSDIFILFNAMRHNNLWKGFMKKKYIRPKALWNLTDVQILIACSDFTSSPHSILISRNRCLSSFSICMWLVEFSVIRSLKPLLAYSPNLFTILFRILKSNLTRGG